MSTIYQIFCLNWDNVYFYVFRFQRHHRQVWLGTENVPSLHNDIRMKTIIKFPESPGPVTTLRDTKQQKKTDLVIAKDEICSRTRGRGREKVLIIKVYFTVCNVGYGSVTQRCRSENLAISAVSKNEPYSLNNFMGKYQDFVGFSLVWITFEGYCRWKLSNNQTSYGWIPSRVVP